MLLVGMGILAGCDSEDKRTTPESVTTEDAATENGDEEPVDTTEETNKASLGAFTTQDSYGETIKFY